MTFKELLLPPLLAAVIMVMASQRVDIVSVPPGILLCRLRQQFIPVAVIMKGNGSNSPQIFRITLHF